MTSRISLPKRSINISAITGPIPLIRLELRQRLMPLAVAGSLEEYLLT